MSIVRRALTSVENLFAWLAFICLALMMIAVTVDAGGRYFFNSPLSGVYEVTELYFMITIVFLGLAQTQRRRGHVRVDFVLSRLPIPLARLLECLFLLATAVVFGFIAYVSARNGLNNLAANRWTTGVVAIPTGPSWLIASAGAWIFTARLLLDSFDTASGRSVVAKSQEGAHA